MDLRDLLRSHGIPFQEHGQHHHATRGNVVIDCPHCSPGSGRYRMALHLTRRISTCWACGRHWIVKTIALAANRPLPQIAEAFSNVRGAFEIAKEEPCGTFTPPAGIVPLTATEAQAHRKYLAGRGFDPDQLASVWDLAAIVPPSSHQWRVFIPVVADNRQVSWTTRSISDQNTSQRYMSAPPEHESVRHKECLFGEHLASHTIVICEGPFDAMRIGPGAVATMGLSVSRSQILRMSRFGRRAILFDNEPVGRAAAKKLADQLGGFRGITEVVEIEGKDPGSAPEADIEEVREAFLK